MQFLKVQVSLLLGAAGKAEIKIESEETFLNLSYFYNLTQLISRLLLFKARACTKRKSLLAQGFSWHKFVNIIIPYTTKETDSEQG